MIKKLIPLTILAFVTMSCDVSVGDKTDDMKKVEIKNGFSYKDIEMSINGIEPIVNNELTATENFVIHFTEVKNAQLKDGFQHVGIQIKISNVEGEILIESDDLLSNIEQQDPKLDYYTANYAVPAALVGQDVIIEIQLFDKYGTGKYDFKDTYHIVNKKGPVTTGMDIQTNIDGIDLYGQILIGKTQFKSVPADVEPEDELYLYLCGIKNLDLQDNILNLDYEMLVIDDKDEIVFTQNDVIESNVAGLETYSIYFAKHFVELESGSYTWKITCKDKNSDKFIVVSSKINVL